MCTFPWLVLMRCLCTGRTGSLSAQWACLDALPEDGWGGWTEVADASLPPPPGRIASAEVIWCALLFPVRGLGSRRMALWGGSKRGSWREAEQRGRKTLAFHSSFSQFILGDQLHVIQQLGFLFSFQLYTVGEAGKVIFFFFLVLLFHDAIVIALLKWLFGEERKLVNDAEGPLRCLCFVQPHSLGKSTVYSRGDVFQLNNFAIIFSKWFQPFFQQS